MIYETAMDGDDESIGYLPSVDINRMNVAMLLNRLDIAGTEAFKIDKKRYSSSWEALANAREEYYKSTSKIFTERFIILIFDFTTDCTDSFLLKSRCG